MNVELSTEGNGSPLVTVVLTSYNHEEFLGNSIESILNQSFNNFELFIIDDASTDSSPDIINGYAQKDSRVQAIRHDENICELNCFLPLYMEKMQGKYIAIAHSDDAWAPEKLQKQVDTLEREHDIAACFTWVEIIDDNNNFIKDSKHFFAEAFTHKNRSRYEWLHYFFFDGCPLCHPSLLIRKEAYIEYGLFTSGLNSVPDFCKWIRLCLHAEIHVIEEGLTYFRVHANETNTSGDNYANRCRTALEDYFLLSEFKALSNPEDFLKVFPEAKKYSRDDKMSVPFALAQMSLLGSWKMHRLFALETIYALMQNPDEKKQLFDLYGYTEKEFSADKAKCDIFGIIPDGQLAQGYLFARFPDDDQVHLFPQDYYISSLGFGRVSWDLSVISGKCRPSSIVFAVDTSRARKVKILDATKESNIVALKAIGNASDEDEWDIFYSPLPQYLVDTTDCVGTLTINLQTEAIESYKVHEHMRLLEEDRLILAAVRSSTSWKITRPLRKLSIKLNRKSD